MGCQGPLRCAVTDGSASYTRVVDGSSEVTARARHKYTKRSLPACVKGGVMQAMEGAVGVEVVEAAEVAGVEAGSSRNSHSLVAVSK